MTDAMPGALQSVNLFSQLCKMTNSNQWKARWLATRKANADLSWSPKVQQLANTITELNN